MVVPFLSRYFFIVRAGTTVLWYTILIRKQEKGCGDGTVVYEDAEADDARVEVVDQYVVIRETHEFPIVGEWTRDRRKFLKCEIRIHVPAGSIAQGEYDIT